MCESRINKNSSQGHMLETIEQCESKKFVAKTTEQTYFLDFFTIDFLETAVYFEPENVFLEFSRVDPKRGSIYIH